MYLYSVRVERWKSFDDCPYKPVVELTDIWIRLGNFCIDLGELDYFDLLEHHINRDIVWDFDCKIYISNKALCSLMSRIDYDDIDSFE